MMAEIARLPVTSLHAAVASTDDAFVRIVSRLLARLPLGERAAFFDDLMTTLPERPAARYIALVNLGALLPMLPGAQCLLRLTRLTEWAAQLPPGDRDGADVLRGLVSARTFRRLPPGHVGPAIEMLLQAAQQILMAREDLFDYLDDLAALVCLAPWPERAALTQMLEQARTGPTA
ncbi:hypothetical protein [Xylophilus sp. GOD-11R]|uniref:hypothetical protein n=1 Tax=Xylophilus sp. GOD-11R TaxID=3089814 RepID=UPI00298D5637|nr:hypothetical protein [Xylophilus sp. GOD-11R]WPB56763.1 hypothetical protein R9X41_21920 [Xylophilus sp. GOD-11R]